MEEGEEAKRFEMAHNMACCLHTFGCVNIASGQTAKTLRTRRYGFGMCCNWEDGIFECVLLKIMLGDAGIKTNARHRGNLYEFNFHGIIERLHGG